MADTTDTNWKQTAESEVRALVVEHVEYFSRGQCREIPKQTFQAPVWVGTDPVRMLATASDVDAFFERVIGAIREDGYHHSDVLSVDVRLLNRQSAIADLHYRRYREDGTVLGNPDSRAAYLVLRTAYGWRITALLPVRR